MKFKSLILLACVAALSACSFDKNDSLTDSNEIEIREKLKKAYKVVAGTYKGTVGTQVVELRMYTLEIPDGTNSNGAPRKKPALFGNYKRIDPVLASFEFDATYHPDKNELILTNKATALNKDDVHTITLARNGDRLIGKATTQGGYQSNVDLTLTTRQSAGDNGSTEDNEYYDALRRQYQVIAGNYEGNLLNADGSIFLQAEISLLVYELTPEDGNISIPYLQGNFTDLNDNARDPATGDRYGFSDLTLAATYNLNVTPNRLTLVGTPVFGSSKFRATMALDVIDGKLVGVYSQQPIARQATVVFTKKATPPKDTN